MGRLLLQYNSFSPLPWKLHTQSTHLATAQHARKNLLALSIRMITGIQLRFQAALRLKFYQTQLTIHQLASRSINALQVH